MKKLLKIRLLMAVLLGILATALFSCGGGSSYGGGGGGTAAPGAFMLISPADLATSATTTPTLTWTPSTGVTGYRVQVDTTGIFTGVLAINVLVGTTTYSYTVPAANLAGGTTYHWRVIAESIYGQAIAGPRTFTP
jgi:hypothetical protein